MRIGIVGAGALGSIYAARLADAGHDVVLLARGARADRLRRDGLRLAGSSDLAATCTVATEPAALDGREAVLLATKTYDSAAALTSIAGCEIGCVASLENGVLKTDRAVETFGADRALGCMTVVGGAVRDDGSVLHTAHGITALGALSPAGQARAEALAAALDGAGLPCEAQAEIRRAEWTKFATWAGLSAVATLTRLPSHLVMGDPDCAAVVARINAEVARIANAEGIELLDGPPYYAASTLRLPEEGIVARLRELGEAMARQSTAMRQSMLQDADKGKPLEAEETHGDAVRRAGRHDIPVPSLETAYRLLSAISRANASADRGA